MPSRPARRIGAILLTAMLTVSGVPAALAQDAPVADHLALLFAECGAQLELGETECTCVVDRVESELAPIEVEYAVVRITANEPEIMRLREILPLGQRLTILFRITGIVDDCAAGAPYNNPL